MRSTFARTLAEIAALDPRIMLLTADLGYTALEPFADLFPDRFLNVGVAEQNMVGVATGLADAGYLPFVYSIGTFGTLRCYEFIRNGPVQQRLPVRIVGVGAGFEYGTGGASHHVIEDVAVMRALSGVTIVVPADYRQARAALLSTWCDPGPLYYRLSKDETTTVPGFDGQYDPTKPLRLRNGSDMLFVTMGTIAVDVMQAAERLGKLGISTEVLLISSFNTSIAETLAEALASFRLAVVVEAHRIVGGLGAFVCEAAAEHGLQTRVVRCGVDGTAPVLSGSQAYFHRAYGIDVESIVERVRRCVTGDMVSDPT